MSGKRGEKRVENEVMFSAQKLGQATLIAARYGLMFSSGWLSRLGTDNDGDEDSQNDTGEDLGSGVAE